MDFRARACGAPRNDERGYSRTRTIMYCVYIMASRKHGTLYVGITRDLVRRVFEHKNNLVRGFTSRYGVHLLVWFEGYEDAMNAITREKELNKCRREWKINLIERENPNWQDLYEAIAR